MNASDVSGDVTLNPLADVTLTDSPTAAHPDDKLTGGISMSSTVGLTPTTYELALGSGDSEVMLTVTAVASEPKPLPSNRKN